MTKLEQIEARLKDVEVIAQDYAVTKARIKWGIAAIIMASTTAGTGVTTWLAWLKGWLE